MHEDGKPTHAHVVQVMTAVVRLHDDGIEEAPKPRWTVRALRDEERPVGLFGPAWLVLRGEDQRGLFGVWENAVTFAHLYAVAERLGQAS